MGLLRQSYITFHLYQINWLAFYGQLLPSTLFDTLMDNGETYPPYGKKIPHDLESFFFPFKHSPNDLRAYHRCRTMPAETSEKTVAGLFQSARPADIKWAVSKRNAS